MKEREKNKILEKIKKEAKGITLVALVVTIIVLLILAGLGIGLGIGDKGIIGGAKNITQSWKEAEEGEKGTLENTAGYLNDLSKELNGVTAGEIFDETGKEEGKLHVGDFINYTAGNWTEEDITKIENSGAKIAVNNSTSLPKENFQFGGFTIGGSKDENATPYNTTYNYVKDKETGKGVTGWRVFDVNEDGTVTLISAGCPEDYYHPYTALGNYAYISEYILTGNVNANATSLDLGLGTIYLPRDWSMYENSEYGEVEAESLTKERLDDWYTKYVTAGESADTYKSSTFQKIYKEDANTVNQGKYESLIDNYAYYWLCSANSGGSMIYMYPGSRSVGTSTYRAFGVRVLVTLPSSLKIEKGGEKTVISRNNEYTYNIWNIKTN